MRRIAAALLVLALCAAGGAWMLGGHARTADAGVPTATNSPTATPDFSFTSYTAVNALSAPARTLRGVVSTPNGPYVHVSVSSNAPGCSAPEISEEYSSFSIMTPVGIREFAVTEFTLVWPTNCVDPGEVVVLGLSHFGIVEEAVFLTTLPPGPDGVSLVLDCDVNTAGIQSTCTVPVDSGSTAVDVVFVNNGPEYRIGALNFSLVHADGIDLTPQAPPCVSPLTDCNPELLEELFGGMFWQCVPVNPDSDPSPSGVSSFISCYNGEDAPAIPANTTMPVGRMHYSVNPSASLHVVPISLQWADVANQDGLDAFACGYLDYPACLGATLQLVGPTGQTTTPTPIASPTPAPSTASPISSSDATTIPATGLYMALDCAPLQPGIQDRCSFSRADSGQIPVAIIFGNESGSDLTLAAINAAVKIGESSRIAPAPGDGSSADSNPDLNQVTFATVACEIEPPTNLRLNISCIHSPPLGPPVSFPDNGSLLFATLRYQVQPLASVGDVPITFDYGHLGSDQDEFGSCPLPSIGLPCIGATIALVDPPPTATPTQTVPPTATNTPVLSIHKIPEGNANNVDPSAPAANLWICELGPCDGPGEGALRVVEHATSVQDGLGAYEFTVEYDNFVISSVNPCDIVFGPGGAGSARGPVDELDTSAVNDDCSPDPGPGGGTCSYSHILENVIHFGCATAGQTPGPTGDMDLASLLLIPHEDLVNDLFPGNENGILTIIKDNGCELVDILGHPVTGSINGGLTPECGDLAVTVRILEGDLDLNCKVDVTDAQLIAGKYGAFFGSLLYSKWYDLEPALHDLDIDIKDLQKVFGRDGSTCQAPVPPQPPLAYPF